MTELDRSVAELERDGGFLALVLGAALEGDQDGMPDVPEPRDKSA